VVYSCSALIYFSWVCHFDWQEQIAADSANAKELDAVGPDAMESDTREPDAVEPDAGPEV
jgi:hypothetical protein